MIIFPAKSREGFSQLPGRPLTLLPNRLTVAIRSKRRRIQSGPDKNYRANFDFDSALDICQESGVRWLNRLVFSLLEVGRSATPVKVGFSHQGELQASTQTANLRCYYSNRVTWKKIIQSKRFFFKQKILNFFLERTTKIQGSAMKDR